MSIFHNGPRQVAMDQKRLSMPAPAVCLLGSIRTLSLECTGRMTLERIARPLGGTLFAFVNVPQQWSQTQIVQARSLIATLARTTGVHLAVNEVVNSVPNTHYKGAAQHRSFQRCWTVASQTALYETIIRVRTDVYHGFRLPPRMLIKHPNAIYAGFLGAPSCAAATRSSAKRRRARSVDDRFAIVHGRLAQRAYFLEFSETLAELAELAGAAVRKLGVMRSSPECLLGAAIAEVNDEVSNRPDLQIKLRDVRDLASDCGGCTKADALIIRSNCSAEIEAAHWVCPLHAPPAVLALDDDGV